MHSLRLVGDKARSAPAAPQQQQYYCAGELSGVVSRCIKALACATLRTVVEEGWAAACMYVGWLRAAAAE